MVFGGFFLIAGIRNFLHFGERREHATNYGWALPAPVLAAGFAIQLVGGLALVLGIWIVPAAVALIVFLRRWRRRSTTTSSCSRARSATRIST